jgi:hypothetical protein
MVGADPTISGREAPPYSDQDPRVKPGNDELKEGDQ